MLVIIHCLNCHCMSNFGNYLQLDDESQQRNIERIVRFVSQSSQPGNSYYAREL